MARAASQDRIDRLRIRHLRLLALVDELGSLSAAATRAGIAQPAATRMLHELETAFGARLVDREARGARLSAAGRAALERLRQTLTSLDAAVVAAAGTPAVPVVRVGILPLVGVHMLPAAIARLRDSGAALRLKIGETTVQGLIDGLYEREIDCAIGRFAPAALRDRSPADLVVAPLGEDGLGYAAAPSHPLCRRRRLPLADLATARFVLPGRGTYTRLVVEEHFLAAGLPPPEPLIESPSFHTSLGIAGASDLVAVAPLSAVGRYASLGVVRRLRVAGEMPPGQVYFLALRDTLALPSVLALRRALLQDGNI
jgi:DNA-binding transcriptional LysR family regulator